MNWLDLLRFEVRATSMQKAGNRLQISRTAVSLCLAGKYPASTEHIGIKVMNVLGRINCLAIDDVVTTEQCQSYRAKPAPTHNPNAMQHWKACQHCSHNPNCSNPNPSRTTQENAHASLH